MIRTLMVCGASAIRLPSLQQAPLRRPYLRLVGCADGDAWPAARGGTRSGTTLRVEPRTPVAADEEDAERWDGLA